MTVTILTTLTCNHTLCNARAEQCGGVSTELMRLFARSEGWIMIKGKDYCSEHAPLHPTHGTVEEELLANLHFKCECGKIHGVGTGTRCPCGAEFTYPNRFEVCR